MPYLSEPRDLTLQTPHGVFNHRIGFLLCQDGKVLLQKSPDGYWFIPGGRVAFGESTEDALRREIREELALDVERYDLAAIIENFFEIEKTPFHELAVFFRTEFMKPVVPPEDQGIVWGWFTPAEIKDMDVKPRVIALRMADCMQGFMHVVNRD